MERTQDTGAYISERREVLRETQRETQRLWFQALQHNPPNWEMATMLDDFYAAEAVVLLELDEVAKRLGIDPIPSETTSQAPH